MVSPLSGADREVLEHVFRYRLTTSLILDGSETLEKEGEGFARDTLLRLEKEGWLRSAELYPGHSSEKYWHLSVQAAKELEQDAVVGLPLKRDMRIECFAIATFCCCGEPRRQLMTKQEFQEKYSRLWYSGQPVKYYLHKHEDGVRLAYLKVDTGGTGQWERLIDNCDNFLQKRIDSKAVSEEHRAKSKEFRDLVATGRFQFSILTSLEEKKRAIQLELERRKLSGKTVPPIQVFVVPGLFEVVFPAPAQAGSSDSQMVIE